MGKRKIQFELSDKLSLPQEAVTQTFGWLGRKGSGKTYGALKLAELFLDKGVQIIAFDPMGVWHGLRSSKTGKSPGFEIPVLGGYHGDIPLDPDAGELVADFIVDTGTSIVLDMLKMRKGQRIKFATSFAERLYFRQSQTRTPLHLFLEEAHLFAPQRADRIDARMLGAFEDLIRLGRAAGIGVSMISQRPQSIHKDALNQAEVLIVLQMTGPHERKAIKEWITSQGADLNLYEKLPGLKTGEAICWSPGWLDMLSKIKIGARTTFDASATPELGSKRKDVKRAPVNLESIGEQMQQSIDRAKDSDPKTLKKRIRDLEKSNEKLTGEVESLGKEIEARPPIAIDLSELRTLRDEWRELTGDGDAILEGLNMALDRMETQIEGNKKIYKAKTIGPPSSKARGMIQSNIPPDNKEAKERFLLPDKSDLPGRARDMVLWIAKAGDRGIDRTRLAIIVGMVPNSGTFRSYLSKARSPGYLVNDNKRLKITPKGTARVAGSIPSQWPTSEDLFNQWAPKFPGRARDMFRVIYEHEDGIERQELAVAVGMTVDSGTFRSYLSKVNAKNLITKDGSMLFPASELMSPRP